MSAQFTMRPPTLKLSCVPILATALVCIDSLLGCPDFICQHAHRALSLAAEAMNMPLFVKGSTFDKALSSDCTPGKRASFMVCLRQRFVSLWVLPTPVGKRSLKASYRMMVGEGKFAKVIWHQRGERWLGLCVNGRDVPVKVLFHASLY